MNEDNFMSPGGYNDANQQRLQLLRNIQSKTEIQQKMSFYNELCTSGRKDSLKALLKNQLIECGWMDKMQQLCAQELEKQGLVSFHDSQYSLTELGREIVGHLSDKSPTPRRDAQRKEKLQKSYDFLELHRQGLSYQQIGDKYGISRERVRQILASNPEFEAYRQKQKENNYR